MTLLDLIRLGIVHTHRSAEKLAADLIDSWHADQLPGDLQDILGLNAREYQAWTTGGVSLLTIGAWRRQSAPELDSDKPWFKLSGRPPREVVGYLEDKVADAKNKPRRKKAPVARRK
jgi:hypothetical protein